MENEIIFTSIVYKENDGNAKRWKLFLFSRRKKKDFLTTFRK